MYSLLLYPEFLALDHDPEDPNVDHTGHEHKLRRRRHEGMPNKRTSTKDTQNLRNRKFTAQTKVKNQTSNVCGHSL